MTQAQVFNLLMQALPSPQMVRDLDFSTSTNAIRFSIQGRTFRIKCENFVTEESISGMLHSNFEASLIQKLLNQQAEINGTTK